MKTGANEKSRRAPRDGFFQYHEEVHPSLAGLAVTYSSKP
jgi:hypothetical protein